MNQVILLTGASGGIGRAIVQALAAKGHTVLATDIEPTPQPGATTQALDVRSAEAWREVVGAAIEKWGRIDVLINGAGLATAGQFHRIDASEIDRHFDVNLKGAALGMRTVLPHMIARGSGHLINIGSLAAVAPVPGIALYSATKFGLRGLTLAVATEVAGSGVSVSLLNPDLVDTPMIDAQRHQEDAAVSFSGSGLLAPEDVADAVVSKIMRAKPLETFLPTSRGALARVAGGFPNIGRALAPMMRRRGLRRQLQQRKNRGEE